MHEGKKVTGVFVLALQVLFMHAQRFSLMLAQQRNTALKLMHYLLRQLACRKESVLLSNQIGDRCRHLLLLLQILLVQV